MIPPLGWRVVGLHTAVLDGEHISENALLDHGLAEQPATVTGTSAQLLTSSLHALELTLQLKLACTALLGLKQLPSAVDGPVAEVTVTGESQRAWSERVVEEVADKS